MLNRAWTQAARIPKARLSNSWFRQVVFAGLRLRAGRHARLQERVGRWAGPRGPRGHCTKRRVPAESRWPVPVPARFLAREGRRASWRKGRLNLSESTEIRKTLAPLLLGLTLPQTPHSWSQRARFQVPNLLCLVSAPARQRALVCFRQKPTLG